MYSVWEFGENHDDDHHQCHQDILISKLVKSQEAMFNKLIKSQEDMFDKLVKSQKEFYKLLKHNNKNNDGDDDDETSDEDDEEDDDIQDEVSDQDDQQLSDHIESAEYEGGEMMCTETTLEGYEHLFEAAKSGDWKDARESFQKNPEAMSMITNEEWKTAQRIAVLHNQLLSLKEIVKLMPPEAIEYQTRERASTALHAAAMYGYTEAAKVLVNKNPRLTQIRDTKGRVPLQVAVQAVTVGQTETVNYLYSVTRHVKPSPFLGHDGARLLCGAIDANFYDIALSLVKRFPKLVTEKSHEHGICGLESITQRPFAFLSGAKLTWWQRKIYSLTHTSMDSTSNSGTQAPNQTSSERDEENPFEIEGTQVLDGDNPSRSSAVNSIISKGILTMLASANRMPNITQVRHIKQYIYKQKLMHKQALALVSEMFGQIDKAVMDKSQIVEYFSENSNIIKTSIKHGTKEVVVECLKKFPFLIWHELGGQTMIQMAIAERNEKIFNVICETSGKDKIDLISRKDKKGYTLLHYAAKIAPAVHLNSICGTALQVQRELQWFKGVESIIPEDDRVRRNRKGYTAQFIFTQQHKGLVEKGGEWMKDTSGSCMVVAALIATVAFAAVFTVPGGNISDSSSPKNGTPIFLQNTSFMVFATADALALFSSITSVLMFLAIYTSRHAEEDFYKSLPQKLIIGLATLFISMATILVAFGASLFIVLGDRFVWSLIPIALFSCIPLSLFASLQLPLFAEMVRSTYWNCLFGEHRYIQPIKQSNEKMEGI
ncbi:uncharacterized protein LOC113335504 isoform X2 [Papaver somniferum]|uniref:uncharacterized protein LOC113335504 isoform X2 n=1 Tax=Papaver somniferum TaxID=3469 RepID=UPI000E6F77B9|nr:uncharacterized protein LOC113335504 isoform X2 [Papaver somniferum]